jgi:hypothetical protein
MSLIVTGGVDMSESGWFPWSLAVETLPLCDAQPLNCNLGEIGPHLRRLYCFVLRDMQSMMVGKGFVTPMSLVGN